MLADEGQEYLDTRDYWSALKYFGDLVVENPVNYTALSGIVLAYYSLDIFEQAITVANQAIEINEEDISIYNIRGFANFFLSNTEDAEKDFKTVLHLNPERLQQWRELGNALLGLGEINDALFYFRKAIEVDSEDQRAWGGLGYIYIEIDRAEEAYFCLQEQIKLRSNHWIAWNNRAIALEMMGRVDEAIDSYNQAIALYPLYERAKNNLKNCLAECR
jgi:tetratricopeptide (TPR) repeat protein